MWTTRKELETALARAGLGEWSPRLAAAARPTIILEPGPVEEGAGAPIGASRVGGMPDLPSGVPWPRRPALPAGRWKELRQDLQDLFHEDIAHEARPWPLSFVAQVDFAEIHAAGGLEGFPSSGRLLVFYDPLAALHGRGGFMTTCARENCVSALFITDGVDRLVRRGLPVEFTTPGLAVLEGDPRHRFMFRPRRLTPRLLLLPPRAEHWSRDLLALHGVPPLAPDSPAESEAFEAYEQFWNGFAEEHPNAYYTSSALQVGGIAVPWQGPVEADCVKFADDDYLNHPTVKAFRDGWANIEEAARQAYSAFKDRERATHLARSGSWQLVLQFDSDLVHEGGWDSRFYVCIRKSDLAERRFDRCWTMSQCT
jgi:uncharacterized protein YwqG